MRDLILFVLGGIVLPSLINKTTERGRLDFVHDYIQEIWTALLAACTYFYVLDTDSVRGIAMSLHQRYSNHPFAPYLVAGALGFTLLCFYWWATGKVLQTQAAAPTPTPTPQAETGKKGATVPPKKVIQKSHGDNSPNTNQEQKTEGTHSPALQQNTSGGISVQQSTAGDHSPIINSPITIGDVPKRISPQDTASLAQYLSGAQTKANIRVDVQQGSNAVRFADDFYKACKDAGWTMKDEGVNSMMLFGAPGKKLADVVITIKGEPLHPGEKPSVGSNEPLAYVVRVLNALKIEPILRREPNFEDGMLEVIFDGFQN
jgi:hypothetical protein